MNVDLFLDLAGIRLVVVLGGRCHNDFPADEFGTEPGKSLEREELLQDASRLGSESRILGGKRHGHSVPPFAGRDEGSPTGTRPSRSVPAAPVRRDPASPRRTVAGVSHAFPFHNKSETLPPL